jgi:hypothetical protein
MYPATDFCQCGARILLQDFEDFRVHPIEFDFHGQGY